VIEEEDNSIIVRKKRYMKVCLIRNSYREKLFESINTKALWFVIKKRKYLSLILF